MICRSLDESTVHFWQPAEFENVANPDFENLKHLQKPVHLPPTKASKCYGDRHESVYTIEVNVYRN